MVLAIMLAACGSPQTVRVRTHPSETACVDTPRVIVADTDVTIWPDPVDRTWARLESLVFMILQFEQATGHLPDRLDDILPPESAPAHKRVDAWGHPLRYDPTGAGSDYEVRSLGPDGALGTADDLRAGRNTPRLPRRIDPVSVTRGVLDSIELSAQVFRMRHGEFPESITALATAGIAPVLGERDGWGNLVSYTRSAGGIELRSFGPDGVQGSEDDLVLQASPREPFIQGTQDAASPQDEAA